MIIKTKEKTEAIFLRKSGKTYTEILKQIPVAKSTLAIWFHEARLANTQKQRITNLKILTQKKGALKRRTTRIDSSKNILLNAIKDVGLISKRELWLIGIVLYWAEGSKQKKWNVSQSLQFTNSDPLMIRIYLTWLRKSLNISDNDIVASLSIHKSNESRLNEVLKKWKEVTGLRDCFSDRVYFKRHRISGYRRNLGDEYYGTVRIGVRRSTDLNRKVAGWVQGIYKNCEFN